MKKSVRIEVRHAVPGRLRLKVPFVCNAIGARDRIEGHLEQVPGVQRVLIRYGTGSLIVFYDRAVCTTSRMLDRIERHLSSSAVAQCLSATRRDPTQKSFHPSAYGKVIGWGLFNALALTAFMGFSLLRRFFTGAVPGRGPFTVTGFVAVGSALPLFIRSVKEVVSTRRMGLFPFLSGALILAVFAGQAWTALEIIWILSIGLLLEESAAERTRRLIRDLLPIPPERVLVVEEGRPVVKFLSSVRQGDILKIASDGEIPVDGIVLAGEAMVDEARMTGRAQAAWRRTGDWVYAGTAVVQGTLSIRAKRLAEETYLARIGRLIEAALSEPSETEKKADVLARRLTRLSFWAVGATLILTRSLSRAFSVLLVLACPCATVLAASTAVSAAIANAARRGILVKGGGYLERVAAVTCVCFDKTGTLTMGTPEVVEILPRWPRQKPETVLLLAAGAEQGDTHPLAKALLGKAREEVLTLPGVTSVETSIGRGVRAVIKKDVILVGHAAFLETQSVDTGFFKKEAASRKAEGESVLFVSRNGKLQGMIVIDNRVRGETAMVLSALRAQGIERLILLSGDGKAVVERLAAACGFDTFEGDLLPENKAGYVDTLRETGACVMMVGDGTNDALALSRADVGVAVGAGGSALALEAADVILLDDRLEGLNDLRSLAKDMLRIADQNFWLATATNILGILLGAAGWLPPAAAGLLHIGHSAGILVNSGRLLADRSSSVREEEA
ncbi:heavy metal translocating P-type ATPase [Desulfatiglans anilini]|uniref:heavy metal translocating P-type ATPase n=1 Tax=Desulfatiglans anilini TaxID=90728 RepID=UPI00042036B9|nr:cation-translocating P-type ATPase [Desulfatiglans anilini]